MFKHKVHVYTTHCSVLGKCTILTCIQYQKKKLKTWNNENYACVQPQPTTRLSSYSVNRKYAVLDN